MKVFRVKSPRWLVLAAILYNLLPIGICLLFVQAFQRGDLTVFLNIYYGIDILWVIVFLRNKATLFADHFVYYSYTKKDIVFMKDISDVKVKTMSGDKDRRECVSVSTFKGKTIEMPLKDNALFARYIRSYMQAEKKR